MTIERRQQPETTIEYERRIVQLEGKVSELSISPWFGCLTRNALDVAIRSIDLTDLWVCFFDIDRLKQANERWGKPEVSRKIATSIQTRKHTLMGEWRIVIGQWFSGDEFVAILPQKDVLGYAQRTQVNLHNEGLSATFVLLPVNYRVNPFVTINYADGVAALAKGYNHRNLIIQL